MERTRLGHSTVSLQFLLHGNMDVSPETVTLAMESNRVRRLIHGHTHRPAIHEHRLKDSVGLRYVLGDWRPSTTFLVTEDTTYDLRKFNYGP